MRKIIRASLLVLALSSVTYAGHIPNDYTVTPTPAPSPSSVSQEPSDSNAQGQQNTQGQLMTESIAIETALNLLNSVLSLL